MKYSSSILAVCLLSAASHLRASEPLQTASMRLVCTSVLFYPANAPGNVSMRMGTNNNRDNGEAFFLAEEFTHATGFVLDLQGFPMAGLFAFDIPLIDQNGNGLEDFFEVEQGIFGQTREGIWETSDGFDSGTATLTWNRPAGSALGTCRIVMVSDTFGELPEFNHQFELLEYEGMIEYGIERPAFAGEISIASQDGVWTLAGPVDLRIGQAEGEPTLSVLPSAWTDQDGATFSLEEGAMDPANSDPHIGIVLFADGDPYTAAADYVFWLMILEDVPDSDNDEIPDVFDAVIGGQELLRPALSVRRDGSEVTLAIAGQAGVVYRIERSETMAADSWSGVETVTSTGEETVVNLGTAGGATFFRVRAEWE